MERTTLQPPHRSMFSKTFLHTSHASDRSGAGVGDIATPHHPYYSGSGAGTGIRGRGTQPWADHLQTMDQISNMIYAGNQSSFKTIFVISYRHLSYNDNIRVVRHSEQQNNR